MSTRAFNVTTEVVFADDVNITSTHVDNVFGVLSIHFQEDNVL